jgi:cell division GTPase FtsZ
MLSQSGVYGLDFACLQTMLHNCDGFCHFASAEAEGQDRGTAVASAVLSHRLLNKGKILSAASGVIVGLVGGTDLMLNEIETVMNQIYAKLPSDTWVNFGVLMEPEFAGKLSAMVLVAEQWKEPLVDAAGRQMGFSFVRRVPNEQGELPLETTGKGRFTHVDPTVHNHEDLDVPTYIRREIKLPR